MADHHRQVQAYIQNDLPQKFGSRQITEMHADLEKDLCLIKLKCPAMGQKQIEMMLHHKHREFAFSYPGLFFKIVRGEVDSKMLASLLKLKENLDENSISLDAARNRVIDCAKHQIEETKDKPRVKKAKPPGTVVQELSFKCKPSDS